MANKKSIAIFQAFLAAACYGVSTPVSKFLLTEIPPAYMAALLYLGAGLGMGVILLFKGRNNTRQIEAKITKKEKPYIIGMITLDIAAPILLMFGLRMTIPAKVALLNNFEIVVTSIIALLIFKEAVGKRMWTAIFLITLSTILLSVEDFRNFSFSLGGLFVLLACVCWGFENNCTKMLSLKDPVQIVVVKGVGAGLGSFFIALALQERIVNYLFILWALLLGFFAYGLSIYFYILAQRELGAARTSAYYAVAPFIGAGLSFLVFQQDITVSFVIAFIIMIFGAYFAAVEKHSHAHTHTKMEHEHRHNHTDIHHAHQHEFPVKGEHSHVHVHEEIQHTHSHTPDLHHIHPH